MKPCYKLCFLDCSLKLQTGLKYSCVFWIAFDATPQVSRFDWLEAGELKVGEHGRTLELSKPKVLILAYQSQAKRCDKGP